MGMMDPKTNFMLMLELLCIAPRKMAESIGTDATLISRWRTGKRRLVAGRPWVKKISAYFVDHDDAQPEPLVAPVIGALYPGKPLNTREQRIAGMMQFLLCSGQQEPEYRQRRYQLLRPILGERLPPPREQGGTDGLVGASSSGRKKLMAAVMEFLSSVAQSKTPRQRMVVVAPSGLNPLTRLHPSFVAKLLERLIALFCEGHTLCLIVSPGYKLEGSEPFRARFEAMHLGGYIETHYCDEQQKPDAFRKSLIFTAQSGICVSINLPDQSFDRAQILTIKSLAAASKAHATASKLRLQSPEQYQRHFFESPESALMLPNAAKLRDERMYCFGDLPLFGLLSAPELAALCQLTEAECTRIARLFWPICTSPAHFRHGPVRHIVCQDEVERALITDDVALRELSLALGREIRIGAAQLSFILRRMLTLLESCPHYELAFLPRHVMEPLSFRALVIENFCALGVSSSGGSAATTDPAAVARIFHYGESLWKRTPSGMKSHSAATRTILEQLARR